MSVEVDILIIYSTAVASPSKPNKNKPTNRWIPHASRQPQRLIGHGLTHDIPILSFPHLPSIPLLWICVPCQSQWAGEKRTHHFDVRTVLQLNAKCSATVMDWERMDGFPFFLIWFFLSLTLPFSAGIGKLYFRMASDTDRLLLIEYYWLDFAWVIAATSASPTLEACSKTLELINKYHGQVHLNYFRII